MTTINFNKSSNTSGEIEAGSKLRVIGNGLNAVPCLDHVKSLSLPAPLEHLVVPG